MLGRFLLGACVGPVLLIALGYAFAFPGWALLLIAGPFVLVFAYAALKSGRPLEGSTEASRTDRPLEPTVAMVPPQAQLRGRLNQHHYRLPRKHERVD